MINMNRKMTMEIADIDWSKQKLSPELADLVDQGFLDREGCVFVAALARRNTNAAVTDFPDRTGYECFVNSIHVDDYIASNYLAYACLFVESCFAKWRHTERDEKIMAIISCDEFGAVVKIHLARDGESWIGSNLEKYEDAILVADSASIVLR